jgi:hypothetical protein
VYDRSLGDRVLGIGVAAFEDEALALYDDQTRSRWSQLSGTALSGELAGEALETVPSVVTSWRRWRSLHPETDVYINRRVRYRPRFTLADLPSEESAEEIRKP